MDDAQLMTEPNCPVPFLMPARVLSNDNNDSPRRGFKVQAQVTRQSLAETNNPQTCTFRPPGRMRLRVQITRKLLSAPSTGRKIRCSDRVAGPRGRYLMTRATRRSILGTLAAAGVFGLGTRRASTEQQSSDTPSTQLSTGRMRALWQVRMFNSLQSAHFYTARTFATMDGLRSSDLVARARAKGLFPQLNNGNEIDFVQGFRVSMSTFADLTGYVITAEELGGDYVLRSDQNGVIYEGMLKPLVGGQPGQREFAGRPLGSGSPKAAGRAANGAPRFGLRAVKRVADSVTGFFLPTVYASQCDPGDHYCCCEGNGCGYCIGPGVCGQFNCVIDPDYPYCCNLGYADCTWCCSGRTPVCGCLQC